MDVDMIKSSSSTAGDHHHHHQNHFDMMTIMMQMEKPSPDHQLISLETPPQTFLDINFSETPAMFPNPNLVNVVSNSPSLQTTTTTSSLLLSPGLISEPVTPPPLQPMRTFKSGGNSLMANSMSNINNDIHNHNLYEKRSNSMVAMREMIFRIAAMQPIHIDPESIRPPKRRNVKISKDPQSVAARHRRERISERIRILQRLVPGGTKMDTASMLDEAIHYVKFLKKQVQTLEQVGANRHGAAAAAVAAGGVLGFPAPGNMNYSAFLKGFQPNSVPMLR